MWANFGKGISDCAESQEEEMQTLRMKGFTLIEVLLVLSIIGILVAIAIFHNSGYLEKAYDAETKEDLRQAYSSAVLYFADYPEGNLTVTDLEKYGFKGSRNVNIRIIDGRLKNLLIISYYNAARTQAYMVSHQAWLEPIQRWVTGTNPPSVPPNSTSLENEPQKNTPPVEADLLRVFNRLTILELQEAFRAAQAYFSFNSEGAVTKNILLDYGYIPNENIKLTIIGSGTSSELSMSATFNMPWATNYMINNSGNITSGSGPVNG
jgi:prepilin-type N-terminal cleavage/methylation domain-containing protein